MITHRLAGLEAMDEIIVLDAGRVVERGTHADLVAGGRALRQAVGAGTCVLTSRYRKGGPAMLTVDLSRVQFAVHDHLSLPFRAGHHRPGLPGGHPADHAGTARATPSMRRLTRFFGTLLLINVAIGVVTGLVQEFEFGMNWSAYSRFVGDVFGAPAGHGGPGRLLPGVDLPGAVGLRLGPPAQARPPGLHLAGGRRQRCCRPPSSWPPTPGCSTRSATPSTRRPGRAELNNIVRPVHQPGVPVGLRPRPAGFDRDRGADNAGRVGLAPAQRQLGRGLRPTRPRSRWWSCCPPSSWPCSSAASSGSSRPSTSP